jgi:hypothetical protein
MPNVLITGGAGFIGSHLCRRFLDDGWQVVCMDNLLTGRLENIADLFGREGFRFVKHDVTNFIHVPEPLDAVLHFASPASPADFERLPIQILKVGALGTHNALGVAHAKKARFLLASTSECYGDPEVNPQPETYRGNVNPVGIRGVYDEAKRFAEAITMAYHRAHGLVFHRLAQVLELTQQIDSLFDHFLGFRWRPLSSPTWALFLILAITHNCRPALQVCQLLDCLERPFPTLGLNRVPVVGHRFLEQVQFTIGMSERYSHVRFRKPDQRFLDRHVDIELSLGDFVLSGGEPAALAQGSPA